MLEKLKTTISKINQVLLGKEETVFLAITCLLAKGHLLLEDTPGMGKTTLAESLAKSFGLEFNRVHFTSDLLPADLTGVEILDSKISNFCFKPGPMFTQVLLADEINRTSPRTQSALLEAMCNYRVSVDGKSHTLPKPFFVIASQNSLDQTGTSPLPESQLDRFLMRLSLGFPDRQSEESLLKGLNISLENFKNDLSPQDLIEIQLEVDKFPISESIIDYVLDLVAVTRRDTKGLSPRAAQGLIHASKAWAYLKGSKILTPDHVKSVFEAVAEHRLDSGYRQNKSYSQIILSEVDGIR